MMLSAYLKVAPTHVTVKVISGLKAVKEEPVTLVLTLTRIVPSLSSLSMSTLFDLIVIDDGVA